MVKKVNTEEFQNEAMKAPMAVVDFNATWCGPCRMLAPVLEDISEKYADKVSSEPQLTAWIDGNL